MTESLASEPVQIGLSELAHFRLEQLRADGYFHQMADGYRFAVALAISRGVCPQKTDGARKNVYSTSSLDPDGLLKLAVEQILPSTNEPIYRVIERLADWGVLELDRLIREEYLDLVTFLPE